MESVASISAAATPGDWETVSLDLTDGYFHVQIAQWFRKYLRFVINGQAYQFYALPFGLASDPRIFTKMIAPMATHLLSRGISLHSFIDDILVKAISRDQLLSWTIIVINTLMTMGYKINLTKSMLEPTRLCLHRSQVSNGPGPHENSLGQDQQDSQPNPGDKGSGPSANQSMVLSTRTSGLGREASFSRSSTHTTNSDPFPVPMGSTSTGFSSKP